MREKTADEIKREVAERYGAFAREKLAEITPVERADGCGDACCGTGSETQQAIAERIYGIEDLSRLPDELAEMSRGCGNPTAIAGLQKGEWVLDLGSGAGLDCFLAAQAVGPSGHVVGLDMNEDMLRLARRNAEKVGATNVEFRHGEMESIPLPESQFDVIISNCVLNLSPDKDAVFREAFRVLKPGGRLQVSDIVWTRPPTAEEVEKLEWAGCVAGALVMDDYRARLEAAGFVDIRFDAPPADGAVSADIIARKPGGTPLADAGPAGPTFRCC